MRHLSLPWNPTQVWFESHFSSLAPPRFHVSQDSLTFGPPNLPWTQETRNHHSVSVGVVVWLPFISNVVWFIYANPRHFPYMLVPLVLTHPDCSSILFIPILVIDFCDNLFFFLAYLWLICSFDRCLVVNKTDNNSHWLTAYIWWWKLDRAWIKPGPQGAGLQQASDGCCSLRLVHLSEAPWGRLSTDHLCSVCFPVPYSSPSILLRPLISTCHILYLQVLFFFFHVPLIKKRLWASTLCYSVSHYYNHILMNEQQKKEKKRKKKVH